MRFPHTTHLFALLSCVLLPCVWGDANASRSSKRGLVFVPSSTPSDNKIWIQPGSDLTWYYNYAADPSPALKDTSLQFVPMLFSASQSGTAFLDGVKGLISSGTNISYVLSYNEPDGSTKTGGSNISPQLAASAWIRELEPLRKLGLQLGAPAMTGSPAGFTWLRDFFIACNGGCTADFFPVHWYGNFEGLASHIGQVVGTYPNKTIWITEYALPHASLSDTQSFFNTSAEYFDRLDYVTHYSYFGSFRSSKSNVGPNAAMLDQDGKLTDIGSWYLGGTVKRSLPNSNGAVTLSLGGCSWVLFIVGIWFYVLWPC